MHVYGACIEHDDAVDLLHQSKTNQNGGEMVRTFKAEL
jgi:hypothetical protein